MKKFLTALLVAALLLTVLLMTACQEEPEAPVGHVHKYQTLKIAPTCVAEGYTTYECSCGDYYESDITPANRNNHVFGDWYTSVEPDCTTKEMFRHDCKYCDHYEEANKYEYKDEKGKKVTVTGTIKHTYHDDYRILVPATCDKDAYYIYECIVCQDKSTKKNEAISKNDENYQPKLGHDNAVIREVAGDCATETFGIIEYADCSRCGAKKATEYLDPHTPTGAGTKVPATCLEAGYTLHTCANCGVEYIRSYTVGDHKWGSWSARYQGPDGLYYVMRECETCHHTEEKIDVNQ